MQISAFTIRRYWCFISTALRGNRLGEKRERAESSSKSTVGALKWTSESRHTNEREQTPKQGFLVIIVLNPRVGFVQPMTCEGRPGVSCCLWGLIFRECCSIPCPLDPQMYRPH